MRRYRFGIFRRGANARSTELLRLSNSRRDGDRNGHRHGRCTGWRTRPRPTFICADSDFRCAAGIIWKVSCPGLRSGLRSGQRPRPSSCEIRSQQEAELSTVKSLHGAGFRLCKSKIPE